MRRLVLSLTLVLAAAPFVRAQDGWKWDPKKKRAASVGYRASEEGEIGEKQSSVVSANKVIMKEEKKDEKTTFKITRETKAVEKDKATEEVLKVEKWSMAVADGDTDTTLEGQTIVVKTKDGKKSYELPDDKDHKVSEAAKGFIEQYYAKKKGEDDGDEKKDAKDDDDDPMQKAIMPDHPIADGEEWTGDPAKVAKAIFDSADLVDATQSSVKGKLTDVKVDGGAHCGHVEVRISLKLKSVPGAGEAEIPWTKGGVFEMTCLIDGSLEPDVRDGNSLQFDGGLKGSAKVAGPQGTVHIKMDVSNTIHVKTTPLEKAGASK